MVNKAVSRNQNQISMSRWTMRKITEMAKSYMRYYTFEDRDDYYFYTGSTVAHLVTIMVWFLLALATGVYTLLWMGVISVLAGVYFWIRSGYRKEMGKN